MTETVDRARVFGERPEAVERIAPGYFWPSIEEEHLARYKWASRWVRDRTVLDVACGTGYGAAILRAAGARSIVSFDVSLDALWFGAAHYGIFAVRSDVVRLPLRAETCEAVVSLETIEHLESPLTFVNELWRVIRPGGELLLSTPNADRSEGTNPYHLHEMTLAEVRAMLDQAGFHLEEIWGQHWGLGPGMWHKIKGLRGILWRIEHRAAVTAWMRTGLKPLYWCLRALRV